MRRRVEQEKQRAMAEIQRERFGLERRLRRQQQVISQEKHDLATKLTGELDVGHLRRQAGSTLHAMRAAQQLALELAGVHRRLEYAREELVEAAKHRQALELLRDRRFQQWKGDQARAETAAADELAVIAAARKENEP